MSNKNSGDLLPISGHDVAVTREFVRLLRSRFGSMSLLRTEFCGTSTGCRSGQRRAWTA